MTTVIPRFRFYVLHCASSCFDLLTKSLLRTCLLQRRGYPPFVKLELSPTNPTYHPPHPNSHMGSCRKLARVLWQPLLHCGRNFTPRPNRFYNPENFAERFSKPRGLASVVKMGIAENYDEVLKGKYPAKEHARKVARWLIEKGGDKNGTIYLEAQKQKLNEDNDGEAPFRFVTKFPMLSGDAYHSMQATTLLLLPQWVRAARLLPHI